MDEGNPISAGAFSWLLVDQLKPFLFESGKFRTDIIHFERKMMNTFASSFKEFTDGRTRGRRFRQLHGSFANMEISELHLLVGNRFRFDIFYLKQPGKYVLRFLEISHRNTDMG